MNKLVIPAALLALGLPTLAHAQDTDKSGPYFGLSGGIALPGDSDNAG